MKFTDPNVRPKVQAPSLDSIPEELRQCAQWVLWKFVWNKHTKQWVKVPFDGQTLTPAKSNDPSTWTSFETVQAVLVEGKGSFDGIGWVFSVDDPYFGADFDNCVKNGEIDPSVIEWIERFDSYTEKSVSGTGLHVIGKGVVGDGIKTGDFELYDRGRYFTVSGNVGRRKQIQYRQEAVETFKRFLRPEVKTQSLSREVSSTGNLTVREVLDRAFRAEGGTALRAQYDGSWNGYKSPSEAIASMCWKFAFWTDRNAVLLDAVIRGSRLCDSKWDSPRGDSTWGAREVETAISKCKEFFDWNRLSAVVPNGNGHAPDRNQQKEEQWEPPATFYEHNLSPFPASELPESLRFFANGIARETQTPIDLTAMLALTVCAGAAAGHVQVQARPGWIEPINIYVVGVMPPGERKSAVFAKVCEPLEEIERNLVAAKRDEIARAASEYRMLEERKTKLEKDAARSTTDNPEEHRSKSEEAIRVAQELAAMRVPVTPRILVSDVTPEVLATLLTEQGGRMCLLSPEGDLFDMLAGRYSNGTPHFDVILKAHCGDTLRVDRRGRSEFVQRPALTIGLAVQPEVVRGLMEKPGFRGRGLLARIFYVWPQSLMGNRQIAPESLSERDRQTYTRTVQALARIEPSIDHNDLPCPRMLRLTEDANETLKQFERELEPKLSEDAEFGGMADWAGKLAGAIVRLAGILWLVKNAEDLAAWPDKIDATTMKSAIKIGEYLTQHARAAFAEMGANPQVEKAKILLRWIEETNAREFTRRKAHQARRSRFKTVDEIDPAIELLLDHNYIRRQADQLLDRRPGRKASQGYDVNPFVFSGEKVRSNNAPDFSDSQDIQEASEGYQEPTKEELRRAASDPEEWRRLEQLIESSEERISSQT